MAGNKRLLIFRDKICTGQKYTQKVKWKRSTKLIFLKFSGMKWNIFYNFKVKCRRPLIVCLEVPNVYPPIVVVQIDFYSKVNKIHVAHFWVCMMATVGAFIDCQIRSDFRMGASTLLHPKPLSAQCYCFVGAAILEPRLRGADFSGIGIIFLLLFGSNLVR
jgi:hypothetical protein